MNERPSSVVPVVLLVGGLLAFGVAVAGVAGYAVWRATEGLEDAADSDASEIDDWESETDESGSDFQIVDHTGDPLELPEHVIEGVLTSDGSRSSLHVLPVPEDTILVRATVACSTHDVDLGMTFSRDSADAGDWDITADGPDGDEWVWSFRKDKPGMSDGRCYVHVQGFQEDEDDDEEIAYTLTIRTVLFRTDGAIHPGDVLQGELTPLTGHRRNYLAAWPVGADAVRFDVLDAPQDVDLFVGFGDAILDLADYEHSEQGDYCTESVVILREDGEGETLLVTVVDQACEDLVVPFTLVMSEGADAPEALRAVRRIPPSGSATERAAQAVVRLDDDEGHGSGILIAPDGLVLAAQHVTGNVGADLVVSIATSPATAPLESYRATVIHADAKLDVALVQIDRLLDGSPLPAELRFPTVPVRWDDEPRLGDTAFLCGYHDFGEDDARDPISWTPGAVSGWHQTEFDPLLRVAAVVSSGASGGAVFDDQHRLVGTILLMFGAGDGDVGGEAAAASVTRLPAHWTELQRAGR